jgi:hypothetical protein
MTRWTFGITAALALAAAPGFAQVESKCLSGKLKGAGHAAASQVNCEAKAAAKGEALDPECVAKAGEKLQKAFEKAENKDDCIGTGDDPAAQAVVDAFVQELLDTLNPPPVVCCQGSSICLYVPASDPASCTGLPISGVVGAPGTVCTGTGACAPPPAAAGSCCQDFNVSGTAFDCANGVFDASGCASAGGTFSTAICSPSGSCL